MTAMIEAIRLCYDLEEARAKLKEFDLKLGYSNDRSYVFVNSADELCEVSTIEELRCFVKGLEFGYNSLAIKLEPNQ